MPILDGLESTRLIRQMGYSAPIVALSAFAEESNIKDCIDCGMDMFMRSVGANEAHPWTLARFDLLLTKVVNLFEGLR
jgi:FOG: CheY-like receiver